MKMNFLKLFATAAVIAGTIGGTLSRSLKNLEEY